MMKVPIKSARVHVKIDFARAGSVLAQTIEAGCDGVETILEVESDHAPETLKGVVRNAEAGCFVIQSIANPVPVSTTIKLNGEAIS